MTLTEEDYRVVIGDTGYKAVSQCSAENVRHAETEAQEEMAGYLRTRFDTEMIFEAEGDGRNPLIVMYMCDIALYHLSASLPQKMGMEIRKERYERAIRWLEGVQAGKIVPDLPRPTGDDGTALPTGSIIYGSDKKLKHQW